MICQSCRERHHAECRGGSWCDCQHKAAPATPSGPSRPVQGTPPEPSGERVQGAEPPVNWKRQG
ncbi:hypothetical protein [Actinomadura violacea]|uniref:Uncharacterized protein n=1 Tax=Actinomadura violacea TaxID=2819934 RepID=A0ABS3S081_9ACTN|nr:hypothetical protein [Actinomadura violacea]MBO2462416.1 hypothetical protein [Actinomadura violacea]